MVKVGSGWLLPRWPEKKSSPAFAYGASGELAYVLGGFGSKDKPESGKLVLVWRKVDGRWMIAADMNNGSIPRAQARSPCAR